MLSALRTAIKASTAYGNSIKMNYYFVFSGYSVSKYKGYGVNTTQYLGRYLSCAAKQQRFNDFVSNLSIGYDGSPLSNLTLYQMALGSGLNTSALGSCIDNIIGIPSGPLQELSGNKHAPVRCELQVPYAS
jgi:hypothetical protein